MSAHKLPRTCSKCQAKAPLKVAIAKWHHRKSRGKASCWTCDGCYQPPEPPPRTRPLRRLTPMQQFLLMSAAASMPR